MTPTERYQLWLEKLPADDPMREELLAIRGDRAQIEDRFYKEIAFGTAGLRGKSGAGTNRMNPLVVGRATKGLADYIALSGEDPSRGVVIAWDCRYHSKEYAYLAAEILTAAGIRTYLFADMRPTPELSFTIRSIGALAGINMTASHNPKEYNGYKVYWKDGAQISGIVSDGIAREIEKLDLLSPAERMPLPQAQKEGILHIFDEQTDRRYLDYVLSMAQRDAQELDRSVPIVYTPLNGAGSIPVRMIMGERRFTDVSIVEEQAQPDPEFSTVGYPNPEDPKAFALAERLGRSRRAQVLIATDPDSDRMAVEILGRDGDYHFLNGNQTGAMLIAYMAESQKEKGRLTDHEAMIKSIVTGDMGEAICKAYDIRVYEALTGFKNICGRIPELEKKGEHCFFAYEESIGCAPGPTVRDKDGICAAMLVAEMAAWNKKNGRTLEDYLELLYETYGYYAEEQISLILEDLSGAERIRRIMNAFRTESPEKFGDFQVESVIDYQNGWQDIPPSDVLKYVLTDGSWFALRPSGTEPKLKFYFYTRKDSRQDSLDTVSRLKEGVMKFADNVQ